MSTGWGGGPRAQHRAPVSGAGPVPPAAPADPSAAAALYGLGVYFAAKAAVSAQEQYSPCGTDGNKYIFVAKALTGDYTLGSRDMRAPPLREAAGAPRRYDSVVDNLSEPSIFVIFNDTQAYPQYLITCRRSKLGA